uniref:Uncharacterized protein n=1 Tax=uncultured marine virus TaxID=186617 RepID=A0A0F7L6S4_9VIRU|nr:hypothetical protein [uncultured marine virus]
MLSIIEPVMFVMKDPMMPNSGPPITLVSKPIMSITPCCPTNGVFLYLHGESPRNTLSLSCYCVWPLWLDRSGHVVPAEHQQPSPSSA